LILGFQRLQSKQPRARKFGYIIPAILIGVNLMPTAHIAKERPVTIILASTIALVEQSMEMACTQTTMEGAL
jgi:hypothetical protein